MKKKLGMFCLVLVAIGLVWAGAMYLYLSSIHSAAPAEFSDTKEIGTKLFSYAQDHDGNLPRSLELLEKEGYWKRKNFTAMAKRYAYFYTDKKSENIPPNTPILLIHVQEGAVVYVWGGNCFFIRKSEFYKIGRVWSPNDSVPDEEVEPVLPAKR